MHKLDKLLEMIYELKNPRFSNEKQIMKLVKEILDIHTSIIRAGKITRKHKRRIKKVFGYGLPYDLYTRVGIHAALEKRHIQLIRSK